MRKYVSLTFIVTAACLLCAGFKAFPQSSTSSPGSDQKSKRRTTAGSEGGAAAWHVVRQGDTLYSLARAHGTTVARLKSLNHLASSRLQIGQKLRLSVPTVEESKVDAPRQEGDAPGPASATPEADRREDPVQSFMTAGAESEQGKADEDQTESTQQPLRYRLASAGLDFLGVRYRWNGNSARSGFDCSGMVKSLFEKFNIDLPRSSREQYKVGEKVDKNKLEVGDLVFFSSRGKTPTHVGVYLGDNLFLHAARKARKVLISNLTAAWYSKRFLGARRLSDLWESEPTPAESK